MFRCFSQSSDQVRPFVPPTNLLISLTVDTNDWRVNASDAVLANLRTVWTTARALPSWIHLQHDSMGHSMRVLPQVISFLRAQGVEFVTLDQCVGIPAYRDDGDNPFLAKRLEARVIKGAEVTTKVATTVPILATPNPLPPTVVTSPSVGAAVGQAAILNSNAAGDTRVLSTTAVITAIVVVTAAVVGF